MSKYFVVKPCFGLANRLRALASSMAFAEVTNRELLVCWTDDYKGGFDDTPFGALFSNKLQFITLNDWNSLLTTKGGHFSAFSNKTCKLGPHLCKRLFEKKGESVWTYFGGHNLFEVLGMVYFQQYTEIQPFQFLNQYEKCLRSLQFSEQVQIEIDTYAANEFNDKTAGFHIRRGDALQHKQKDKYLKSSDEKFMSLIKNHLQRPDTRAFIATDSKEFEDKVRGLSHPSMVKFRHKKFVDSKLGESKGGQIDAAVEWGLLARCCKIFGNNWSSFSTEAARYGRVPLITV